MQKIKLHNQPAGSQKPAGTKKKGAKPMKKQRKRKETAKAETKAADARKETEAADITIILDFIGSEQDTPAKRAVIQFLARY